MRHKVKPVSDRHLAKNIPLLDSTTPKLSLETKIITLITNMMSFDLNLQIIIIIKFELTTDITMQATTL